MTQPLFGARIHLARSTSLVGARQQALLEQAVESRKGEIALRAPGVTIDVYGIRGGDFAEFSLFPSGKSNETNTIDFKRARRAEANPFDLKPLRLVRTEQDAEGIPTLTASPNAFLDHALAEAESYAAKYGFTAEPDKGWFAKLLAHVGL